MNIHAPTKFMNLGFNIDAYKYYFYPRTIIEWNKLPNSPINALIVETLKDRLKLMPSTRD